MKLLENAIKERGKVLPGDILKVGSFLNHNIDVVMLDKLSEDVYEHFKNGSVTKVLTVEASGIAMATLIALKFGVEMVFAKKSKTTNVEGKTYSAQCYSYTHKNLNTLIVPSEYLKKGDKVLVVDDFLATGEALNSLLDIVKQAEAETVGFAIGVEKGFQGGGDKLREKGYDVYSLAIVDKMDEKEILFRN